METCNAVGCFKTRHKSTGGYEYSYCYDHWVEQMENYKLEGQSTGVNTMPKSDTCTVEGCNEPRMRNGKGEMLTMCDEHQRAYWRQKAAEQQAKKPVRPRATQPPVKVKSVVAAVAPLPKASDNPDVFTPPPTHPTSPLFDSHQDDSTNYITGTPQLQIASDALYEAASQYIERQHECNSCEAKAVIEALRAKSPKLAKLIDAMQAEVEAAAELGI